MKYYQSDRDVKLGDNVEYNHQAGVVMYLEGKSFDVVRYRPHNWRGICKGLLIEFENGALLDLDKADDRLLVFVSQQA